jgi:hypothetical protein
MPGIDGPKQARDKYFSALYRGPQPTIEFCQPSPSLPDRDIVDGESQALFASPSALAECLPDGMAEILVDPRGATVAGQPQYALKARCYCMRDQPGVDLGVYRRPNLELDLGANMVKGGPQPATFLDRMGSWSYPQTKLAEWLSDHRDKHRDRLELVIKDVTWLRIPWELFWSPSVGTASVSDDYLGAVLTVTRWLGLESYQPQSVKNADDRDPHRATGSVIAYVAEKMRHDKSFLDEFDVDYALSVKGLLDKLADADRAAPAVVYVACEGEFGDDPDDVKLDRYPVGRATRRGDRLPSLSKQSSLVFLNSCHTGPIGVDVSRYNDGALRGFAVVFLRSGAGGVLATTGAVGNKEAGELAATLFRWLTADRSLAVAEVLRRLRADAARDIAKLLDDDIPADAAAQQKMDETLLPLLYPFMYVYFGNPRMLMSIAARGGDADASGPAGTGGYP